MNEQSSSLQLTPQTSLTLQSVSKITICFIHHYLDMPLLFCFLQNILHSSLPELNFLWYLLLTHKSINLIHNQGLSLAVFLQEASSRLLSSRNWFIKNNFLLGKHLHTFLWILVFLLTDLLTELLKRFSPLMCWGEGDLWGKMAGKDLILESG